MRRLVSLTLAVAALLAFGAGPAAADQALKFGQGPPVFTGDFEGKGAFVIHCNAFPGESSVAVFNRNGAAGNCDFGDF